MRVPVRLIAVGLSLAIAAPLRAQIAANTAIADTARAAAAESAPSAASVTERTPAPSMTMPSASSATMTSMRAGVHSRETSRPAQPLMARANLGQSRAMMVVGVAALITGAIIGGTPGTVIMVGGAVVGLLGLYDYLQ
ncbi:MAG TPA: hypothetical protein VHB25_12545 [Gemmatimonadaceae bacterium]|nr:hypothetical protein [Gemmatimonadaceae bacterium]